MLYLLTSSNSFPHQKIEKVRVINLTQGGGEGDGGTGKAGGGEGDGGISE